MTPHRAPLAFTLLWLLVLALLATAPGFAAEHQRGRSGETERRRSETARTTHDGSTTSQPNRRRTDAQAESRGSEAAQTQQASVETSRSARRKVMREQDIPTSQQPVSQSRNESGREQSYQVPTSGGGTEIKSVQQQTKDRSHQDKPHWEAGRVKTDPETGEVRKNRYGRPSLESGKSKAEY